MKLSKSQKIQIDPRTKLLLTLTINIITVSVPQSGWFLYILPILWFIPFILLFIYQKYKIASYYLMLLLFLSIFQFTVAPYLHGFIFYLSLGIISISLRLLPGIMMGYFLVSTTSISKLIAAMEKLHFPKGLIISLSVMFRFFPTLSYEYLYIQQAMAFRGLTGFSMLLHPFKAMEYRLIPLIVSASTIGNELTMTSLTRGLSAPVIRTNVCQLRFYPQDFLLIFISILVWLVFIWEVLL
ncbi:energy-coupling factor transporter transmembrane component T [Lysinibacillus sphaericus]|uniref:energy-coupling factor transporter transmembrane component T n=1 Tax=Lysinibacillus sphaericus TaxID=1421 RepID=UPI00039F1EE5|nr:energy-coupling factor transporter transmembrane component T [Lysinibacillus sphaericus]